MKLISFLLLLAAFSVHAKSPTVKKGNFSKSLDFESDVVEGVNKKPYDQLSQLGDGKNGKKRKHLYSREKDVGGDIDQTLRDMRYTQ